MSDLMKKLRRLTAGKRARRLLTKVRIRPADEPPSVEVSRLIPESVAGPQTAMKAWRRLKELQERDAPH